ncbi:MAG: hypothetical protein K8R87_07000 [Verrucomicrobia bacterium]|nr:hypothetical protein [Verrucomicrobiota bacterium]
MRIFVFLALVISVTWSRAAAIKVSITPGGGLLRDGRPYFIKGAGGREHLDELVKRGGNSVRIWSERDLPATFEQADKLKFTVCAGIWLEPECSWFSYRNEENCERQLERVRKIIRQYREYPALLLWGLGNEAEGDGRNDAYWQQLNRLARMVHQEDPAHPTFTAVAGLNPVKMKGLNQHTPDLDFVGINTYGALPGLREYLKKVGWTRSWIVTEFGPRGFWESPKTSWNAPIEQTSSQKADMIQRAYEKAIAPGGMCVGSYLFLWGQKQEATATWFGVFTKNDESTATADVMEKLWSNRMAANRAPELKSIKCSTSILKPSEQFTVQVEAVDPDGDTLQMNWEITDDSKKRGADGREIPPPSIDGLIQSSGSSARIKAPAKPGAYRVFVFVTDAKGHAATANVPVLVKP